MNLDKSLKNVLTPENIRSIQSATNPESQYNNQQQTERYPQSSQATIMAEMNMNEVIEVRSELNEIKEYIVSHIIKQEEIIKGLSNKLNELISEFNKIETELKKLKKNPIEHTKIQNNKNNKNNDNNNNIQKTNKDTEDEEIVDRNGYKMSEISVEQIFNFSGKRF